jgi:DNA-directed RNA polymerase subunit RPC12/RpoP
MEALCDSCQQRPAKVFVTSIVDGVMSQTNLCEECSRSRGYSTGATSAEAKLAASSIEALRKAHCRYCGGQPCREMGKSLGDFLNDGVEGESTGFMCTACAMEYSQFVMKRLPEELPQMQGEAEARRWMHATLEKAEAHMRDYVAAMKAARCRYCGGQPCTGGMDVLLQSAGGVKPEGFMCAPCAKEYERYFHELKAQDFAVDYTGVPEGFIAAAQKKVEAHMRGRAAGG